MQCRATASHPSPPLVRCTSHASPLQNSRAEQGKSCNQGPHPVGLLLVGHTSYPQDSASTGWLLIVQVRRMQKKGILVDQHLPGPVSGEEERGSFCVLNLSSKIQHAMVVSKCPVNCGSAFTMCFNSHSIFVPPPAPMIREGVGGLYTCVVTFSAPTGHTGSMQGMPQVALIVYCCLTPALALILGSFQPLSGVPLWSAGSPSVLSLCPCSAGSHCCRGNAH